MGHVWYDALTSHLDPKRIGVADVARATMKAAMHRFGRDSDKVEFLAESWNEIGVRVRPSVP